MATAPVASAATTVTSEAASSAAAVAAVAAPRNTAISVWRSKAGQTYGSKDTALLRASVRSSNASIPQGRVAVVVDNAVIAWVTVDSKGKAEYRLKPTANTGKRVVQFKFVPTDKTAYKASKSKKFSLTIRKVVPTVTTTFRPGALTYAKPGILFVKIKASGQKLGGTVTISRAGKAISSGRVSATGGVKLPTDIATLPGKKRGYAVSYSGYGKIASAKVLAYSTVGRALPKVGVELSRTKAYTNQKVTATITVTGPMSAVDGTVTVKVGATRYGPAALNNGRATITIPAGQSAGNMAVTAKYMGDSAKFRAATAAKKSVTYTTPSVSNPCPVTADACVDLTNETAWLQSGGQVVYGPVKMTAGRAGNRTNPGVHYVFWKDKDHKSSIFGGAPMPNSVFFDNDIAFHQGSLYVQSHGCIHLDWNASEYFFNYLSVGDQVVVFGTDPY